MSKVNSYHELDVSNLVFDTTTHSIKYPYVASRVTIVNDSWDTITISYNGRDIDGVLEPNDSELVLSNIAIGRLWFKTDNPAGSKVRVWAWGRA